MVIREVRRGFKGYRYFLKILKKNNIDLMSDFVVLIPKEGGSENRDILSGLNDRYKRIADDLDKLYFNDIPIRMKTKIFMVITDDEAILNEAYSLCPNLIDVMLVSSNKIWDMIIGYTMFPYSDRLIIGMIENLPGREHYKELQSIGISKREIIERGALN